MPHFDWMAATIPNYPGVIVDALMALDGAHDAREGRGRMNYGQSTEIVTRDADVLATVLHGGLNPEPHAFATGEAAQPFTDLVRSEWPAHRVSRYDSAFDVCEEFEPLHASLQAFVSGRKNLKGHTVQPDDPRDGATYYIGSPTSAVRFRLYEKSKELAKKLGSWDGIVPGVLRFELQVRPERKEAKAQAASLDPVSAWGVSPWARQVAREHLGDVPRVIRQPRLLTTFERTHRAMLAQYGPHLRELVLREGEALRVVDVLPKE